MKDINTNTCERVDDLVGFLYGELDELESRRFELHLHECVACAAEYAAFGQIHESMMAWRDESLGLAGAAIVASAPSLAPAVTESRTRAKSALAALREFFALSPLWLKGATAFATVLFCVSGVLAVAYLKWRPAPQNVTATTGGKVYTAEEVDKQVATAIEKIQQEQRTKEKQSAAQEPTPKKAVDRPTSSVKPREALAGNLRRPFTQQERQELAADLRLINSKDEDDPDLIGDSDRP